MATVAGKVVKQLAGSGTGQSLMDRVNAAKHSLAGSALGKSVIKATTEELISPKKKHVDYLVQSSNEPNVSIPSLADLLLRRLQDPNWVVVFKTLITVHNVINFGNERFSQYLASNNSQISLPGFTDKTGAQAYEMSLLIRQYSKYVHEKMSTYRLMAFDFCKIKRGRDDGVLRTMPIAKLLKTLPVLQNQLDVLLEFEVTSQQMSNPILKSSFILLYKDMIRIFASYNEGMINLIEKYFSMKRKQCRQGLELYKGFALRMDKVTEFATIAESIGIGDRDSLGLQPVPEKVLKTLENHLNNLEGKKKLSKSNSSDSNSSHPEGGTQPQPPPASSPAAPTPPSTLATTPVARAPSPAPARPALPATQPQHKAVTPTSTVKVQQNSAVTVSVSNNTAPSRPTVSPSKPPGRASDDLLDLGFDSDPSFNVSPAADTSFNPFATIVDGEPPDSPEGENTFSPFSDMGASGGLSTGNDLESPAPPSPSHEEGEELSERASEATAAAARLWGDDPGNNGTKVESLAAVVAALIPQEGDEASETEAEDQHQHNNTEGHALNNSSDHAEPAPAANNATGMDLFDFLGGGDTGDLLQASPTAPTVAPITMTATPAKTPQPAPPAAPAKSALSDLDDLFALDPFSSNFKAVADPVPKSPAPTNILNDLMNSNKAAANSPIIRARKEPTKNLLDSDLDSTLASLAGSLSSVSPTKTKWAQQNQPQKLTGGNNFTGQQIPSMAKPQNATNPKPAEEANKVNDPFGDL